MMPKSAKRFSDNIMLKRMRLVLFDLDGTLVDSAAMIYAAMARAFGMLDAPAPEPEPVRGVIGLSLFEAIHRLAPERLPEDINRLVEAYRVAYAELRANGMDTEGLFPGARETILTLVARDDVRLGIATGKSRKGVRSMIARHELEGCFTVVQTADDAPSKPHPAMIEQALAETGMAREDAVMIGDSTYDMEMARAAGITAIGVGWGYHPADALREAGAHQVVDDFEALRRALTSEPTTLTMRSGKSHPAKIE